MLELLGALLGGIGLFLLGIKGLGTHLQSLAGRRMRAVAALGQLAELAGGGDAEDAALPRRMADDRGAMMDGLRRRLVRDEVDWPPPARAALFAATAQFERAVWLLRRQALLLTTRSVARGAI